jgi:tryptophan 2,3-dioxygenase
VPALKRIGHKGAAHIAPGNTAASFDAAIAAGVDMIEFDVLAADDGQLLLAHDHEHIEGAPTLDEGLAHLAPLGVDLDVDLKLPGYEAGVVEALRAHGLVERSLVSTQYMRSLVAIREIEPALRLLRRSALCLVYATTQLDMLEQMSPWEYQEIRKVLGHGSGFDSPGWNALRHVFPRLGQAFHSARREAGLSLADLYVQGREHETLYQLAEGVIELDEQAQHWRLRHFQVVARVIGDKVVGTQGTPVELLGRLVTKTSFPELWEVRNELTARSKDESE